MNVVGYLRVSTDEQGADDKFGLDAQREKIQRYCDKNGMRIVKWYQDKISGTAKERPGFSEILKGVSNPPIEGVVVARTDRIARDLNVFFYYKLKLLEKDIKLITVDQDFSELGALAPLLESFIVTAAAIEREAIITRTSSGRKLKAKNGGYSGGRPPYGYKVVAHELEMVPREAEAVRRIFSMKESGSSFREIVGWLNENGYKTHSSAEFGISTVQTILENKKTYQGMYRYGKDGEWVRGAFEAILPEEQ